MFDVPGDSREALVRIGSLRFGRILDAPQQEAVVVVAQLLEGSELPVELQSPTSGSEDLAQLLDELADIRRPEFERTVCVDALLVFLSRGEPYASVADLPHASLLWVAGKAGRADIRRQLVKLVGSTEHVPRESTGILEFLHQLAIALGNAFDRYTWSVARINGRSDTDTLVQETLVASLIVAGEDARKREWASRYLVNTPYQGLLRLTVDELLGHLAG